MKLNFHFLAVTLQLGSANWMLHIDCHPLVGICVVHGFQTWISHFLIVQVNLKRVGLKSQIKAIKISLLLLSTVIYRHPRMKNDNDFLNYISNTISNKVRNEKKTVLITGDFNINLLNIDSDDYTSEF